MKTSILLVLFLLIASLLTTSGQKKNSLHQSDIKDSPWSVSLSYSPHFAFSFDPPDNSRPYRNFLYGFNGRFDRKVDSERVSLSFGVSFRNKIIQHYTPGNQGKVILLEFPFQVNYHLCKSVGMFDPYLISSIRICRFRSEYFGVSEHSGTGVIANPYFIDYLPLFDIGCGTFIRIKKNLSLLLESNIGYGLTNILPNRAYFDLLIGIRRRALF